MLVEFELVEVDEPVELGVGVGVAVGVGLVVTVLVTELLSVFFVSSVWLVEVWFLSFFMKRRYTQRPEINTKNKTSSVAKNVPRASTHARPELLLDSSVIKYGGGVL